MYSWHCCLKNTATNAQPDSRLQQCQNGTALHSVTQQFIQPGVRKKNTSLAWHTPKQLLLSLAKGTIEYQNSWQRGRAHKQQQKGSSHQSNIKEERAALD
jgi:hypothetical protein